MKHIHIYFLYADCCRCYSYGQIDRLLISVYISRILSSNTKYQKSLYNTLNCLSPPFLHNTCPWCIDDESLVFFHHSWRNMVLMVVLMVILFLQLKPFKIWIQGIYQPFETNTVATTIGVYYFKQKYRIWLT